MLFLKSIQDCMHFLQCFIVDAEQNETLWSTDVDVSTYYSDRKLNYLTHDVETGSPVHYKVIMVRQYKFD